MPASLSTPRAEDHPRGLGPAIGNEPLMAPNYPFHPFSKLCTRNQRIDAIATHLFPVPHAIC
jgi:hypothetical protein